MLLYALLFSALASGPSKLATAEWMPLVQAHKYDEARARCGDALSSSDPTTKAEGHKCLANVELGTGKTGVRIDGNAGGGALADGCSVETARKAIAHLDAALSFAPHDLSIHQGRLHVLEMGGLYGEMAAALKESIRLLPSSKLIEDWLAYPAELHEAGQSAPMVEMLLVLDAKFPNDHRILGNLSAGYGELKEVDKAVDFARRAVALAPKDPIDNWNLAKILDDSGQIDEADSVYRKTLKLKLEPDMRAQMPCLYAEFVATKRKDAAQACTMQRKSRCELTACPGVPAIKRAF